jgi:hypothetical protein
MGYIGTTVPLTWLFASHFSEFRHIARGRGVGTNVVSPDQAFLVEAANIIKEKR